MSRTRAVTALRGACVAVVMMGVCSTGLAADAQWNARMRALLDAFGTLAPYIYSRDAFEMPENRDAIEQALNRFGTLTHSVGDAAATQMGTHDPGMNAFAEGLAENTAAALAAFRAGELVQARNQARAVVGACFQCHSRTAHAASLADLNLALEDTDLKPTELADVYVATRQFDRALTTLRAAVDGERAASTGPVEFQKAIRKYLAIAVRVKRDPALAAGIVDAAIQHSRSPSYLQEQALEWRREIDAWRRQTPLDDAQLLREANRLVDTARAIQHFPLDNRADVLYLVATAYLHDFLRTPRSKPETAEALYLLGHSYDVLRDVSAWFLNEAYFEACIEAVPHSDRAMRCFRRLERSVHFSYSGSGGLNLPASAARRLRELEQLAR